MLQPGSQVYDEAMSAGTLMPPPAYSGDALPVIIMTNFMDQMQCSQALKRMVRL